MNKIDKHLKELRDSEAAVRKYLEERERLTIREKVVGLLLLIAFVGFMGLGIYVAVKTGEPLIPYNPDVMNWSLPWWMVD